MSEPAASHFEIGEEPHFPLHILRSMRAEVDALLTFLPPESKTEIAHNGTSLANAGLRSRLRPQGNFNSRLPGAKALKKDADAGYY
jgi:hypothetical protein